MNVYIGSQKGVGKEVNEDSILVGNEIINNSDTTFLTTTFESGVIAIADGVGGNNAGEVASHYVLNEVSRISEISTINLIKINERLLSVSELNEEFAGMATTFSCLLLNDKPQIFSVGNSRVYSVINKKYLNQITNDDTTVNYLIQTGQISEEESHNYNKKNEITACFGGGKSSYFKIKQYEESFISSEYLLSSDGLHDYVLIDEIENILFNNGFSEETCELLIKTARLRGSLDDISVILISKTD